MKSCPTGCLCLCLFCHYYFIRHYYVLISYRRFYAWINRAAFTHQTVVIVCALITVIIVCALISVVIACALISVVIACALISVVIACALNSVVIACALIIVVIACALISVVTYMWIDWEAFSHQTVVALYGLCGHLT